MKTCKKCGMHKRETEFYTGHGRCKKCVCAIVNEYRKAKPEIIKKRKKNYYDRTREERCAKTREWRAANPERHKQSVKAWRERNKEKLRMDFICSKYGISKEEYEAIFEQQKGRCAICGTNKPGKRGLFTDHCHSTGVVRGLLCSHCNTGIGYFRDNISFLLKAITYLQSHKKKAAS